MPYTDIPPTRTITFRELVEKVDGENRHLESTYPVVYEFSSTVKKRSSGPASGIYETS